MQVDVVHVRIVDRVAILEKMVVDCGKEQTGSDTGETPGGQNHTMERSNVRGSKHVA